MALVLMEIEQVRGEIEGALAELQAARVDWNRAGSVERRRDAEERIHSARRTASWYRTELARCYGVEV